MCMGDDVYWYGMLYVYRRHEDLKQMLDSSKDNLKLEAMKRIIGVSIIASL